MKKSYQKPYIQHILMQHADTLLQGSPKGRFSDDRPSGWDAGGANSRQGGWDDEE